MKITINTVFAVCSRNEPGLTAKTILQLLEQPKSKKSQLRKILRSMAQKSMISKKNDRYYLAQHISAKSGSYQKANKNNHKIELFQSQKINNAIIVPGKSPAAFIPGTGKSVSVKISPYIKGKILPWDTVQLAYNNESKDYSCNSIIRHNFYSPEGYFHVQSGTFNPFGFEYLKYPIKQTGNSGTLNGVLKININLKRDSEVKGKFVPKPEIGKKFKDKIKNDLFQTLFLPKPFSGNVLSQSNHLPSKVTYKKNDARADLRHIPFITIDGETAKDFDDAVYAEKKVSGYRLLVAIADVSLYVDDKTAIDTEAIKRGNSYYMIDQVFPMLPEKLSNELCSLKPGVNRNVLVCELFMDLSGNTLQTKIYRAVIKSIARMTYEECDTGLNSGKWRSERIAKTVAPLILLYRTLHEILKEKRQSRGMIEFSFPERFFDVSNDGTVKDIKLYYQTISMSIIEQFMLEANEAVAAFCRQNKIPIIWRNHLKTDLRKISMMSSVFGKAGINTKNIQTQTGLNDVLRKLRKDGLSSAMEINLLRCMSKANYETKNRGHFGLAAEKYCHFTSPIRRYADLFNHRNIVRFLKNEPMAQPGSYLAKHISDCEISATSAEMKVKKLYQLFYAGNLIGKRYEGKIIFLNYKGLIVEFGEQLLEGNVTDKMLGLMGFRYDSKNKTYSCKQIHLGMHQPISVIIVGSDYKKPAIELLPCF